MNKDAQIELFTEMLRIRKIEEKIAEKYLDMEMRCPMHLSIGQEAVAVGVCSALRKEDLVYSGHRAHAHYLAKGGSLTGLIAELYGLSAGCSGGRGGSMHLTDMSVGFQASTPIVGGTIPLAVGAAWAMQVRKLDTVSVVFFGDGCFEEGVVHESLNYAALKSLPVIFVCENNNYSVYTQLKERQPKREIYKVAQAHGVQSHFGDGNDVVEIASLSASAVENARSGHGPQFLELETFRWREHCGPNFDDDLKYREKGELASWQDNCPIQYMEQKLKHQYENFESQLDVMNKSIESEIEHSFKEAQLSSPPCISTLTQKVYAQ